MLEIITLDQIVNDYGFTRRLATKYLNKKGCPVLPRKKNQPYKIVRSEFEEWLKSQRR